jgi:hypothetical protein
MTSIEPSLRDESAGRIAGTLSALGEGTPTVSRNF